jgi:hypothetical protein
VIRKDISHGYLYFIDKQHPLAGKDVGKVYLHRHVASLKLGRWLKKGEVVHHIDHNKENNRPSNLEVLTNSTHGKRHRPLLKKRRCRNCKKTFKPSGHKQRYCSMSCWYKTTWDISKKELSLLVWKIPSTKIAKMFGVCQATVRRQCKRWGITEDIGHER